MAKDKKDTEDAKSPSEMLDKLAVKRASERLQGAWADATTAFIRTFEEKSQIKYSALPVSQHVRALPYSSTVRDCLADAKWGKPNERESFEKLRDIYQAEAVKEFDAVVAQVEKLMLPGAGT